MVSLERGLVQRAQAGDRQAVRKLLVPHMEPLYARVILPRTGDPARAQDILKETMVTAIEKLHTFRWQGRSIYHWLRQIAANKVVDHHRGTGRAGRLAQNLEAEPELAVHADRVGPGPEAALIAEEERQINRQRIEATLERLNPRYREAIQLRLVDELSRQECARRLGVTVGTFDVVMFRAVRAFRREFEG